MYDIEKHQVDVVVMNAGWKGDPRFEVLRDYRELVYLNKIEGSSTTDVKRCLKRKEEHFLIFFVFRSSYE